MKNKCSLIGTTSVNPTLTKINNKCSLGSQSKLTAQITSTDVSDVTVPQIEVAVNFKEKNFCEENKR